MGGVHRGGRWHASKVTGWSVAVNLMPDLGVMFHLIRLQAAGRGLFSHRGGDVAHQPHPQTLLRLRDPNVILIASVIESKHRADPARLNQ
jgi:hypothetical protein